MLIEISGKWFDPTGCFLEERNFSYSAGERVYFSQVTIWLPNGMQVVVKNKIASDVAADINQKLIAAMATNSKGE